MISFTPKIPKQWDAYSFKINFRNIILKVHVGQDQTTFTIEGNSDLQILVNDKLVTIQPNHLVTV